MAVHFSLLQQFDLLKKLPIELLQQLASSCTLQSFARREVVLEKQSTSQGLFFLLEGKLQVTDFTVDGKEVCLYFIDQGQYFAEISMLDGLAQEEIVVAHKKSQVLMIPNASIKPIISQQAAVAATLMEALAGRVRKQGRQRQILSVNNPVQRVCSQILLLQDLPASYNLGSVDVSAQRLVDIPTHQELAMMTNLSRETVTRVFQVLLSNNVVTRDGQDLVIVQATVLSKISNGTLDLIK
jgi:CRP/FNR family transcriptional regulator, cyclic AMP receptor protein